MTATATAGLRPGLIDDVTSALGDEFGQPVAVVDATRSAYSTSHTIFDLEVDVGRRRHALILKDLSARALLPEARGMRPAFVDDPRREVTVYTSVLAGRELGTARCFAAGEHWLVLEKVRGVELYQVGGVATWAHAAARVAELHVGLAEVVDDPPALLPRLDADYYAEWWRRAARFGAGWEPRRRRAVEWLVDRHEAVVEEVAALPVTIVHGDCSASNVLVEPSTRRVCPVDWEMAALGPGLLDLAALTAGWPDEQSARISDAYRLALGGRGPGPDAFATALDRCRLQLHMQWLGWSPGWVPPAEHRQDSLAEAVVIAERLGL